jgi:TfoX/Sxy family transcriptional regulator of competence genes
VEYDPKELQSVMEAASPPDLELGFRPMFGGIMAYAAGQAFASLSNVGLALKMTGADHAALSEVPDVRPLRMNRTIRRARATSCCRTRCCPIRTAFDRG